MNIAHLAAESVINLCSNHMFSGDVFATILHFQADE